MDIDERISALDYAIERIEDAINEIKDISEFSDYIERWQEDKREMEVQKSELEEIHQAQWDKENRESEYEYERSVV